MQLRAFLFLLFFGVTFSLPAQDYAGVWEGHFFLRGKKNRVNVRIELVQKDKDFVGFVSTRGFEKNTTYGCDYIVHGRINKNTLRLTKINVRRGVAMKITDCGSFSWAELSFEKNDSVNVKSRWFWMDSSKNVFTATKTATEVSDFAREEMNNLKHRSDLRNDFVRKESELHARFAGSLGTRLVENKETSITITSVEKNTKPRMTVTMNEGIVADYFDLSEKVLVIKLKDLPKISNIEFINDSDKRYNLEFKILLEQEGMKEEWNVFLYPGGRAWLRLDIKE
ncbi:hypothetical protein ESA94_05270 [Lacibacter luteus]|uniref:DUF3108 domain-containing protein n=1 Tax=Lacibacter luteus TaxID=2508719 RepID=A0A4Q1CMZ2_9BACT|nr:hypothetical protein [Lacibacter luteus]RXK62420.1 hypothetical protein ESA94_05270 [Lacibacter luteus]